MVFGKSRNTGEEEIAREESAGGSIEVGNCVSFLLLVMLAVGKEIESCFYRFFMPVNCRKFLCQLEELCIFSGWWFQLCLFSPGKLGKLSTI